MSKNLTILLAALLFATGAATAHADEGTITVLGVGVDTCGTWLANRTANPNQAAVEEEFMLGFLTGLENMYALDHHDTIHFYKADIPGWLLTFCAAHPDKVLIHAADAYWLYSNGVDVTPNAPVGNVTK